MDIPRQLCWTIGPLMLHSQEICFTYRGKMLPLFSIGYDPITRILVCVFPIKASGKRLVKIITHLLHVLQVLV